MSTAKRTILRGLLLLSLAAVSLPARADLVTFTFQMHWIDASTSFTYLTSGAFTVNNTTDKLVDYDITVPAPFGTVTPSNSTGNITVGGWPFNWGPCLTITDCFALVIQEPVPSTSFSNVLQLAFPGNPFTLKGGPIVPLTGQDGAKGVATCDDPCKFYLVPATTPLTPVPPPVPEPSSVFLLGTALLGLKWQLRRRSRRRPVNH